MIPWVGLKMRPLLLRRNYIPCRFQAKRTLCAVMALIFFIVFSTNELSRRDERIRTSHMNNEFKILLKRLNASGQGIPQNDPDLLAYVRNHVLIPPSDKPYQLDEPSRGTYSQYKQDLVMLELFRNKTNGFFVECGALDGESFSNTLVLERDYNWTGVLIEPTPRVFSNLKKKQRKSWIANSCLSTKMYPEMVKFFIGPNPYLNSLAKFSHAEISDAIDVQSIPVATFLMALSKDTIDYFSLDVEGADSMILHTIPFDKIKFSVIEAEAGNLNEAQQFELVNFMETKGYTFYGYYWYDYLFIHNSFSTIPFKELLLKYPNKQ